MVIEAILNHAVVGVAAHYMHATLDRAKSEALQNGPPKCSASSASGGPCRE